MAENNDDGVIRLVIEFKAGKINVTGPIQDKVFCYGLIEAAKDAIRTYADKQKDSAIIPVIAMPPGL
jgi:hypothetical protein